MITSRRSFITGLVSFVAAPAIVRAGSLMPVKVMEREIAACGLVVGDSFTITIEQLLAAKRLRNVQAWADGMREAAPYIWEAE